VAGLLRADIANIAPRACVQTNYQTITAFATQILEIMQSERTGSHAPFPVLVEKISRAREQLIRLFFWHAGLK